MCQECFESEQKTGICPSCNIINKVRNLQSYQNNFMYNSIIFGLFLVFLVLYIVNVIMDMFSTVYLVIFSLILLLFGFLACRLFFNSLKKVNKEKHDILIIEMANKVGAYNKEGVASISRPKPILNKQVLVGDEISTGVQKPKSTKKKTATKKRKSTNKTATKKRKSTKKKTTKKSTKKSITKKSDSKKKSTTKKSGKKSVSKTKTKTVKKPKVVEIALPIEPTVAIIPDSNKDDKKGE
jgi:hypothetical protein